MTVRRAPLEIASRTIELETRMPRIFTSSMPMTSKPCCAPAAVSFARLPSRPAPKQKSRPMRTSFTCSAPTRNSLDEAVRRPARELVRERHDQHRVDAHLPQQLFLLGEGEDLLRDAVRRDDGQRVRVKRDDRRRPPQLPRALDDAADDLLMPDVHPVEIADRRHASAGEIGLAQGIVQDQHSLGGGV